MAELGAIAGVVQLVDVALRASGEVRDFLDAYKDTGKDVKTVRDTLRDVEANVRNVLKFIVEFKKSKYATEEFEVLSETITSALTGFDDDVLTLKRLLPAKPAEKLKVKVNWVLSRQKAQDAMKRLNDRNARLNTALEITGRLHGLRIRQDTGLIMERQAASSVLSSQQMNVTNSILQTQVQNHAQLLEHNRHIESSINGAQASSSRNHEAIISGMTQQTSRLDDRYSGLSQKLQHSNVTFAGFRTRTDRHLRHQQRSLDNIHTEVKSIQTSIEFMASNLDTATKILVEELRSTLDPILQQTYTTSATQNEAKLQQFEHMLYHISADLGHNAYTQQRKDNREIQKQRSQEFHTDWQQESVSGQPPREVEASSASPLLPQSHYVTSTYVRTWRKRWKAGSITIQVTHKNRRLNGSPFAQPFVTIHVHFRPSQAVISLPGVSLFHSTEPTQQGFYHIAPMIAIIPVMKDDHPIIPAIWNGDFVGVRSMLATGEGHIDMQDMEGWTLLHYAAANARPRTCRYLASLGLSWSQETYLGRTPMDLALESMFYTGSPEERFTTLQLGRQVIDNMDQRMWVLTEYQYIPDKPMLDDVHPWLELNDYLRQHTQDGWQYVCQVLQQAWQKSAQIGLILINASLERGLNPDQGIFGSTGHSLPLWYWLLYEIKTKRKGTEKNILRAGFSDANFSMHAPDRDYQQDSTILLWSILVTLIKAGANIFVIAAEGFDRATSWNELWTPWAWAIRWNIEEEFLAAIEESGLVVDYFRWEDIYRCKQAIRLGGARRSGVDEEVLELPSRGGLRCRACRKKYCERHERGIFP